MTGPYERFGALINKARTTRRLPQKEAARRLGVHANHLSAIERGIRLPSLRRFVALWQLLEFDADIVLDTLEVQVQAPTARERRVPRESRVVSAGAHIAFAVPLSRARRDLQITQPGLAHAVGCSTRHLARLEQGLCLPSLPLFAQLRCVLRFDARSLLTQLCDPDDRLPFDGFGRVIEQARIGRSLSPGDVARAAGFELAHYRRIEQGAVLPTMRSVVRIHQIVRFDATAAIRWVWQSDALDHG